jgi:hypothetical protein
VSDDLEDLEYDLNTALAMVYGELLNRNSLDKLVAKHGVRRCALWAHWLPRKIASMYAKEPVAKPTAVYVRAVEKEWKVDSKWPAFDEKLHTTKAREEYRKRNEAREDQDRPETKDGSSHEDASSEGYVDEIDEAFGGTASPAVNPGPDDEQFQF